MSFPYYRDEFDAAPPPQESSRGLTGYVLETGKPLLATPDVYDQLIQSGQVELMGSPSVDWLGVPLKVQQTIIGVMAIQTYSEAARLTPSDKDVLVFVSTQVAMAIERKRAEQDIRRLNQDLVHRARELTALNQAGRIMASTLDMDALLGLILDAGQGDAGRAGRLGDHARPDSGRG